MSDHVCQIYVLFNLDGEVDYVGRTARDIRKRLYEHKRKLGFTPQHEIVDRCSADCREVERRTAAMRRGWLTRRSNQQAV